MKKKFNCIEMKRKGASQIYEKVEKIPVDQQVVFWRERTESLRLRQKQIRQTETAGA
jgi:hypothetical protein